MTMPQAPQGTYWTLELHTRYDHGTLWLRKNPSWIGKLFGETGDHLHLAFLNDTESDSLYRSTTRLEITQSNIEQIAESIVAAANEILAEYAEEPIKKAQLESIAKTLEQRLGIKVTVD